MAKTWKEVRAEKRQKNSIVRQEKQASLHHEASKLSEKEQALFWQNCRESKHKIVELHKQEKELQMQRLTSQDNPLLVIDCQFDKLMDAHQLKSCCSQLLFSYSAVKNMQKPFKLTFTSCNSENTILNRLKIAQFKDNFEKFAKIIDFSEKKIEDFDKKEKIVYLTADSENELTELEDDKIYVVGALVDKNHYPGLTQEFAEKNGIKTARLPLKSENLKSRKVITTNQVVEMLCLARDSGNMEESIKKVLPPRKVK